VYRITREVDMMADLGVILKTLVSVRNKESMKPFVRKLDKSFGWLLGKRRSKYSYNFGYTDKTDVVVRCSTGLLWCKSSKLATSMYFSSMMSAAQSNMKDANITKKDGKDIITLTVKDELGILREVLNYIMYGDIPNGFTNFIGLVQQLHQYGAIYPLSNRN
jgi:hypothetical protein